MSLISAKLDQLESRLQTFIEGRLAGLFPMQESWDDLIQRLVTAMKAGTRIRDDGASVAPDIYILLAHPKRASDLFENRPLLQGLAMIIEEVGIEAGLAFLQTPDVTVSPNAEVNPGDITVIARTSKEVLGRTIEMSEKKEGEIDHIPSNAFLIVNGARIFPLDQSLINIGRRSNNHLVIDDPRISRAHAQLRAIRGKYVLFDLDSKGGTFVNGKRISQSALHPRDVISLAGIPLVYGQDDANLGATQQIVLPTSDGENPTKDSQL